MKKLFNILCILIISVCIGCSSVNDEVYVPSIASLKPSETLVMKYRACHSGCTKGTVKFSNGEAVIGSRSLELTTKEIADLDSSFLRGEDEGWFCSIRIEISFKHKKGIRTLNNKGVQIFPCDFFFVDTLTPEQLVFHLNESPDEIPYWRLSPEEQSKKASFE